MIRPTLAHVDLAALQSNFRAIRALANEPQEQGSPGVIAVVKANAYGHGAARVARALEDAGATMLACADIEEGVLLRQAGVRAPILIFGALSVSDPAAIFAHQLTPTVSTPGAARALQEAARSRNTTLHCHLKIDTGMNRLGFRHDNLAGTLPEVLASRNLEFDAVYTHFATADDMESPMMEEQRVRFERACAAIGQLGGAIRARHAANSAAFLRDSRAWYDFVRPGLLLYGVVPPPVWSTLSLKPVLSLTSRVVAVKGVRGDEGIGYGLRDASREPRTIAVIPAGYADGLDTRLSGRFFVLVRGQRAPIVGSVCMDMLMADITHVPGVAPGDDVIFIGQQGDERLDAREMAAAIGTIPYEVLCRIGARIERVYD
ncbi:MAG TPA: alanine racemase [Vicinamibacterales bacterium]|nr:alanine racemase [Vicinamibacterales bacterium]